MKLKRSNSSEYASFIDDDTHGFTDLHYASFFGNKRKIKKILKKGSNINETDLCQRTALHFAAGRNNLSIIKYLLKHKADPSLIDWNGRTPYSIALQYGHQKAAVLLL
tara:strand:+ start:3429 stop:3752 length:324 start_codon:yes stop_codon:yes gene_type:complete